MIISDIFQFTENHRYCVLRNHALSELHHSMLHKVYQPMVGAFAISLYHTLTQHISAERVGYSEIDVLRGLFLNLGIELNEQGRKFFIQQTSMLEAVGLLQTSRIYVPKNDNLIYEFELQCPLDAVDFFQTQHLTLLLRDKIGKHAVLHLKDQLCVKKPEEFANLQYNKENISEAFYKIFELNSNVVDYELEQAIIEAASSKIEPGSISLKKISYDEIFLRFPTISKAKKFVDQLKFKPEAMDQINYVAHKFGLDVTNLCRLLDEEGMFNKQGELNIDALQEQASLIFKQSRTREAFREKTVRKMNPKQEEHTEEKAVAMEFYLPIPRTLQEKCDIHQYNFILRNEPYTRLLKYYFPGAIPESILSAVEKIDMSYKLPEGVINVLIHNLICQLQQDPKRRYSKNFIDAMASDMLLKHVSTYEEAVAYIQNMSAASKTTPIRPRKDKKSNRPALPMVQFDSAEPSISDEEFEELQRWASQMDGNK